MREALIRFLRRVLCRHRLGRLIGVEWDGETVYECAACGKWVRKPLSGDQR